MFFRFVATLMILSAISLVGIALEKQNLTLKRTLSSQHYELHALEEERCRLFLKTQQLGAPPRLLREWNFADSAHGGQREEVRKRQSPPPLLEWRLQTPEEHLTRQLSKQAINERENDVDR